MSIYGYQVIYPQQQTSVVIDPPKKLTLIEWLTLVPICCAIAFAAGWYGWMLISHIKAVPFVMGFVVTSLLLRARR